MSKPNIDLSKGFHPGCILGGMLLRCGRIAFHRVCAEETERERLLQSQICGNPRGADYMDKNQ